MNVCRNYTECGAKTCITFVGEDMRRKMDSIIAARPALFDMSVYRYVDSAGKVTLHRPAKDYLDVEWEVVDTYDTSELARRVLCRISAADDEILTIVVAEDDPFTHNDIVPFDELPVDEQEKDKFHLILRRICWHNGIFARWHFVALNISMSMQIWFCTINTVNRKNIAKIYGKLK